MVNAIDTYLYSLLDSAYTRGVKKNQIHQHTNWELSIYIALKIESALKGHLETCVSLLR